MNLPALMFFLLIGAYWTRVLRLVRKERRRSGRTANFLPPEPLGRALRMVWYPVVIFWIVQPAIVAFRRDAPVALRPIFHQPILAWIAVLVGAAAFALTLVCWKRMGRSWRMGIDPNEKTQLIVTGPYAFVRHPIYALSSLLMLATVIALPTPMMLVAGAIHLLFLQWEARREETHLERTHGPAYASYRACVGRFIPRSLTGYAA